MKQSPFCWIGIAIPTIVLCLTLWSEAGRSAKANTRSQTIKFGVPFKIGLQKNVALPGRKIAFSFTGLGDDSRCPTGRACVWEGQVRASFALRRAGKTIGTTRLTIRGRNRVINESTAMIKPYSIKLLRVDPYPGDPNSATTPIQATVVIDTKPIQTATPKPTPTPVPQPVKKM